MFHNITPVRVDKGRRILADVNWESVSKSVLLDGAYEKFIEIIRHNYSKCFQYKTFKPSKKMKNTAHSIGIPTHGRKQKSSLEMVFKDNNWEKHLENFKKFRNNVTNAFFKT